VSRSRASRGDPNESRARAPLPAPRAQPAEREVAGLARLAAHCASSRALRVLAGTARPRGHCASSRAPLLVCSSAFDEARSINQSLTILGRCIEILASNKKERPPFRESKLTRLLSNAIGGAAKTALVVCVAPTLTDKFETVNSLEFGQQATTACSILCAPRPRERLPPRGRR
jgi:hypothetical protein